MKFRQLLRTAYWGGFLFTLQVALTIYVNSSFLETKIPAHFIGMLYTGSAVLSVLGLYLVPRLINRFGSSRIIGLLILTNIANLFVLILGVNHWLIAACFALFIACNTLIYLSLDIMVEHWSTNAVQGSVRGSYLTAMNTGFMLAPILAGFITDRLGFGVLYAFAIILIIPVFIIFALQLPRVHATHSSKADILSLAKKFISHRELGTVFLINFVLQFFYAWMVIYAPIYLHETAGIAWDTLGILFTIMLISFVIVEYPVGKMADRIGEKPFMLLGLLVMGISTIYFVRAPTVTISVLGIILFVTRIGASMVEVSTESYFFRRVNHDDTGTIGFFRNTYPFAYIVAPIIASGILLIASQKTLFVVLGVICLAALFLASNIKQTK